MNIERAGRPWPLFEIVICCVVFHLAGCSTKAQTASIDQLVAEMTQRIEAIAIAEKKDGVIPRFNQPKTIGCVHGDFRVHEDVPEELRQGIFSKPASYPAMLRFASATNYDDSKKDIRGLSIKVSEVEGPVIWGQPGSQDFVLNSYPALFVATPEDFLSFIRARHEDKKLRFFINPFDSHLKSLMIVMKARKKHTSPVDIRYWSTVPFRHGASGDMAVKYSVTPCSDYTTSKAVEPGENQLRAALNAHLQQESVCYEFGVQKQADADTMPIEDASVIWDEQVSPFVSVATITIEQQDFTSAESLQTCEKSSFNPWQSLADHEPLGRMNAVRKQVYENAARFRNKE